MSDASAAPSAADESPLLIYDGDCQFCGYWARYWQRLTGERVQYLPYQQVAGRYPAIPTEEFRRAVQLIMPDGRRTSAAEASFQTLSLAPGRELPLMLYRKVPGFAPLAELGYRFIAAHRGACYRISRWLWGAEREPARYERTSSLFLRLLGLIYLAAFVSFAVQAQGLIGSRGIMPLGQLLEGAARELGPRRFYLMPMVFWWNASDAAIQSVCWLGAALSLLLVFNRLTRTSLLLLYLLYLSLLYAGQVFMTYQWDVFLLETGFIALLLRCSRTTGIWLMRWLLFRFMFMSGMVKLLSGDPSWWNLSALESHFVTQPLPTPLAWYAAQLPPVLLRFATGSMLCIELVLPFLIFTPRRLRFFAAGGILLLQACILLTGNYNWFNLQTMLLCLVLFDDAALRRLWPQRSPVAAASPSALGSRGRASRVLVRSLAVLMVLCSLVQLQARFGGTPPALAAGLVRLVEPLHLTSAYGLFAVMTTERDEIVIEGSADGREWRAYEFRYKPGDLARRPPWNIPHQPRLDWQMWFAALDDPRRLPWLWQFLHRLLENEPTVTALLASNPFPDRPPAYVRASFYQYRYADPKARAAGLWWQRHLLGLYFPSVRLRSQ